MLSEKGHPRLIHFFCFISCPKFKCPLDVCLQNEYGETCSLSPSFRNLDDLSVRPKQRQIEFLTSLVKYLSHLAIAKLNHALRYSGLACAAFRYIYSRSFPAYLLQGMKFSMVKHFEQTNSVNTVSFNLMSCQDTLPTSDAKVVHH